MAKALLKDSLSVATIALGVALGTTTPTQLEIVICGSAPIRAVMLERLGPTVWNDDPATAMATLEELEETARLACDSRHDLVALGEPEIQDLRDAFGVKW